MKALLCLALAALMIVSMIACGDEAKETEAETPATEAPATEAPATEPETQAPETKHKHDYTFKTNVVAPTCTEDGYTENECECGQLKKTDKTTALGHAWDEGTVTKAATETESGEMLYKCTRCSETRTEVIPKIGVIYGMFTFDEDHFGGAGEVQPYIQETMNLWVSNADHNGLNSDVSVAAGKRPRAWTEGGQFRTKGSATFTKTFNPTNNINYKYGNSLETFNANDWLFDMFYGDKYAKFTIDFDFGFFEGPRLLEVTEEEPNAYRDCGILLDFQNDFSYEDTQGAPNKRHVEDADRVNVIGYDGASWTMFGNALGCAMEVGKAVHLTLVVDVANKTVSGKLIDGTEVYDAGSTTYHVTQTGFAAIQFANQPLFVDNFVISE